MKKLYTTFITIPIAVLAENEGSARDEIEQYIIEEAKVLFQDTEVIRVKEQGDLPQYILDNYYDYIPYNSDGNETVGCWMDKHRSKMRLAEAVLEGEVTHAEELAKKILSKS